MVFSRRERRELREEPRQRQHRLPWVYFAMLLFLVLAFVAVVLTVSLCVHPQEFPLPR